MTTLNINMAQFRNQWKTYADNVDLAENIRACKGQFSTFTAERYMSWLNDFNIFYTATKLGS